MSSERRDGLLDELARVQRDIVAHWERPGAVNWAQWLTHLDRLMLSEQLLLTALEREEAA